MAPCSNQTLWIVSLSDALIVKNIIVPKNTNLKKSECFHMMFEDCHPISIDVYCEFLKFTDNYLVTNTCTKYEYAYQSKCEV